MFVQWGSACHAPGWLAQVRWAQARLSSGILGLRNEGMLRGWVVVGGGAEGEGASLEASLFSSGEGKNASWRSHIHLVRQPNMGH